MSREGDDAPPKKKSGWPKGPFPEKWAFASVEKRLGGAWAAREAAFEALIASGARRLDPLDDPYVRAFEGGSAPAIEALKERCTVWGWAGPDAAPIAGARVALPTTDLFDALVALGVAGPHHGIGNRTIVRFLVQARAFATFEIEIAGEDLLVIALHAKGPEAAQLLAERLPHVAPTIDTEGLEERLLRGAPLRLDWSPRA